MSSLLLHHVLSSLDILIFFMHPFSLSLSQYVQYSTVHYSAVNYPFEDALYEAIPLGALFSLAIPLGALFSLAIPLGALFSLAIPLGALFSLAIPLGTLFSLGCVFESAPRQDECTQHHILEEIAGELGLRVVQLLCELIFPVSGAKTTDAFFLLDAPRGKQTATCAQRQLHNCHP